MPCGKNLIKKTKKNHALRIDLIKSFFVLTRTNWYTVFLSHLLQFFRGVETQIHQSFSPLRAPCLSSWWFFESMFTLTRTRYQLHLESHRDLFYISPKQRDLFNENALVIRNSNDIRYGLLLLLRVRRVQQLYIMSKRRNIRYNQR